MSVKSVPSVAKRRPGLPAPKRPARRTPVAPSAGSPLRLAFYIRRAARLDDQTVIIRQRDSCASVAEGLGPHTSVEYVDDGFSGATMERPALRRLVADVRAGLVDSIVVEDLDRLRRSDAVGLELRDLLLGHGVELHAASGGGIDWLVLLDRLFGARSTRSRLPTSATRRVRPIPAGGRPTLH